MTIQIHVPRRTLVVLCGSAGSGKSTFAARHFGNPSTSVVSSDHCRALICDDSNSQQHNLDAFDLFYYILRKRLANGRFTVADSTALKPEARRRLWEIALHFGYMKVLLVFNLPPELCLQRDQMRSRQVGPDVIAYHADLLQKALPGVASEGWDQLQILDEQNLEAFSIEVD